MRKPLLHFWLFSSKVPPFRVFLALKMKGGRYSFSHIPEGRVWDMLQTRTIRWYAAQYFKSWRRGVYKYTGKWQISLGASGRCPAVETQCHSNQTAGLCWQCVFSPPVFQAWCPKSLSLLLKSRGVEVMQCWCLLLVTKNPRKESGNSKSVQGDTGYAVRRKQSWSHW